MNALVLLADVGALLVLMWAVYVVVRFVVGYPGRSADDWERRELESERR